RDVLPALDLEVEGLVDRIGGLSRRFHRALDETLAEFNLDHGEWRLLGLLARRAPWGVTPAAESEREPPRSSPSKLAQMMDLSTGAVTNRSDRFGAAGLIRRPPD